ncbi:MAG: hypothetical protein AAB907_00175, partial [Patescibacteria group bacterium]
PTEAKRENNKIFILLEVAPPRVLRTRDFVASETSNGIHIKNLPKNKKRGKPRNEFSEQQRIARHLTTTSWG